MNQQINPFDFTNAPKERSSFIVPEGRYNSVIIETVWKSSTNNSSIEYLNVTFQISNGLKIFTIFNLFNQNEIARRIAFEEMGELLHACKCNLQAARWMDAQSTKMGLNQLLFNRSCVIDVTIEKTDKDKKINRIKKYSPIENNQQTMDFSKTKIAQNNQAQQFQSQNYNIGQSIITTDDIPF